MKYKLLIIWTVVWAILITLLSVILFTTALPSTTATFFDVLHQVDVSAEYTDNPTLLRIIFEPFVGLRNHFILETEGLLLILGIYILLRIGGKILEKRVYKMDFTCSRGIQLFERTMSFFAAGFSILLGLLIVTILIAYAITFSFLVIGLGGIMAIYFIFWILTGWLIGCFICYYIAYTHPNGKLATKWQDVQAKYYSWRSKRKIYKILTKKTPIKKMAKEGRRFVVFVLFIGYFIVVSLFAVYPTRTIQTTLAADEFLFDFHGHTIRSDGYFTPGEKVEWYRSQGIAGAAFSDHHGIYGALDAEHYTQSNNLNFTVIIAQEYTLSEPRIHLNIYGLRESINPTYFVEGINVESSLFAGQYLNVSDMIHYVKSQGAYVTVNHYSRGNAESIYSFEQLRDWGVDGFEIANGGGQRDAEIRTFCLNNSLICMGGSDIADHTDLDTFVKLKLDDPTNRSVDAIFAALRKNQHEVVIVKIEKGQESDLSSIVPDLQEYFATLNFDQRLSWLIWSIIVYGLGSGMYFFIRKKMTELLQK